MVYNKDSVQYALRVAKELGVPEEQAAIVVARLEGREPELQAYLAQQNNGVGYRRNGTPLEDVLEQVCTRTSALVPHDGTPRVYSLNDDFLAVENIQCVDADGNAFEQYDKLLVDKDVVRSDDGKHVNFTSYRAIVHFERDGSLFVPSLALSCNLAAALYQHRDDPEVKPVLMQYQNHGDGYGWHAQNTVIDWGEQKVIHYPHKNDFTEHGGKTSINQARQRTLLPFARTQELKFWFNKSLSDTTLENGLKDPLMVRFVRQLTGLQDPSVLVELGNYFGKTARVWVSSSNKTRAAWFGCYSYNLYLYGSNILNNDNAARGVRLEGAEGDGSEKNETTK